VNAIETHWWERTDVLAALVALMALPLLWPTVPPLVDLPAHMSRYAVAADAGSTPSLAAFYHFEWRLIGNLGVDLLVVPLAHVIGVEWATKLVVLAIPPLTALGFVLTGRAVQGRVPPTALFALPLAYGYPFQFGFVNYALSMALAFLAFPLWLRMGDAGRFGRRAGAFVVIGLLLWICHAYGWGVLGLLAASAEFYRLWRAGRPPWRAALLTPLHCLPLLPPAILMVAWRSGESAGGTGKFFEWTLKGRWVLDALRDRWEGFDLLSVGVILAVLALVLPLAAFGRGIRFGPRLAVGALAMVAAFVLMPRIVIGSNYADMRMVPFVLAALLLAVRVESARLARWTAIAGVLFLGVRIAATTVSYAMTSAETDRQLEALDHVADGGRVVALVENSCRDLAAPTRVYHLPSLAVVRRHAFVNDQFELPGAQLLTVRYTGAQPFVEDPSQIVTPSDCGSWRTTGAALARLPFGGFDHLWLINVPRAAWSTDPRLTLRWSDGASALFDAAATPGAPPPAATRRRAASPARSGGAPIRTPAPAGR